VRRLARFSRAAAQDEGDDDDDDDAAGAPALTDRQRVNQRLQQEAARNLTLTQVGWGAPASDAGPLCSSAY
jgi:hypothetical protein